MDPDRERAAYIAVALTPGVGPARLRNLLGACGTACEVLATPLERLCAIPGVSRALATALTSRSAADGMRVVDAAHRLGGTVLVPGDSGFPARLGEIPEPPMLLFAQGNLALLERPAVAIVGSRDHTRYGADVCRTIAALAARAGAVVVSGMARGLDAIAHAAALDAGGGTIGVLGNGLGVVYPAANRALYERVATAGLLLTEFPPGERPQAGSFPRRNRLISGLARVTVVVEAAPGSGALITAGAALEQGREVMAVPGAITSPTSVGTNRLIRDGAMPFLEARDLADLFPELTFPADVDTDTGAATPGLRPLPDDLGAAERLLAEALGDEPIGLDALATRLGLGAAELLARLSALEVAGLVEQGPGGLVQRR